MKTFRSAASQGQTETIIKKSRFITRVFPVDTEEQAEKILNEIRELHKDATHNVYAWQVGVNKTVQRCSDDGEPGGTAGRPVLEVIKQNDLVNILVIVTRYFGGIKLGAGGLIRAYSQAAREGIAAAGIVEKALHGKYKVTVDYPFLGQVQSVLEKCGIIEDVTYGEQVCFSIFVREKNQENLERQLMDVTGGQAVVEFLRNEYHQVKTAD
jgi:uncharacterized YigZ family protein